jgi:hypothetical protein
MVSRKSKLAMIVIAFVALMLVGIMATSLSNKTSHGGQGGLDAGRGFNIGIQAFRTEFGVYVRYDVKSLDAESLDVFLVTYDQLMSYMTNGTFTYIPQGSSLNITSFGLSITLDSSNEVYDLMIMSNNSNASVPFEVSYEQAPFPLVQSWILDLSWTVSWIGTTFLFFLAIAIAFKK